MGVVVPSHLRSDGIVSVVSVAVGDADGDIVVGVAVGDADGDNVRCETQWKAA